MHYPFYQIGCRMVVARNSEYNTVTRRIWAAFGARETRIPELRSPTEDEIVHTLTKKAWEASKFVRGTHGQR
jgi:RimJ/RimL family protein N-acetyltransferase